ncbi:MAG: glycosyltransferase family 2 protein [Thermodesulfovibrionia bacterium]|nr:glycosyltransferase family 2 protein [Thermodesulfovibrionia bacterium]
MLNSFPSVLAVIINWNGRDGLLLECLDSITGIDYPGDRYKVMVIDNASSDGSQEAISLRYPDIILVENKENAGYVKAVNQGVEYGLKSGADYIWVLNNDVVVQQDVLNRLVEAGEKDEEIGVIAPVIYYYDRAEEIDDIGYRINFWTGRLEKLKLGRTIFTDSKDEIADVDSILGCANLIKADVFRRIGYFKTIYKLYFEETDFNVRAKRGGFRVVVVRGAKVLHKEATTMNRFIFKRAWLLLRNLFVFELLNARLMHLVIFIPYYFFIHLPYFIVRGTFYGLNVKLAGIDKMEGR